MGKDIRFSLVYRDMWQSAGKYVPRVDQLVKIAPEIVDMGCFARVETNGGGFEQINLLFGENPNKSVREWTKAFNEAGIETHMLDRSLNGLRMNPVPADVRKLFYKVKKAQGTDIARSFCGLNDSRNISASIKYAKDAGMVSQATLSLTYSPVHTVEYYCDLADELIANGADEICLKDMAGIGRPVSLGKIVKYIKEKHPNTLVQYHGQTGPGFTPASILEVAKAGCEIIDVGMEPLSWGTGHADILMVKEMLKDAGFSVPDVNMKAYMNARALTQEFIDDFLGYYIPQRNRQLNSLLIAPGLPGGMMGSLMNDLKDNQESLNKWFRKRNKPEITQDELMIKLFDEVAHVWPKVGYPPLVTPFSQYVKNLALFNVTQMEKGKERWSMIADNIWDMILGKSGKLPGEVAPEIKKLAKEQGRELFTGSPQDEYPDKLDEFRKEMKDNNWDFGQDEEELFELAMHPEQYRAYKSGEAKKAFEEDLAKKKVEGGGLLKGTGSESKSAGAQTPAFSGQPSSMNVNVNGENFKVTVSYGDDVSQPAAEAAPSTSEKPATDAPADAYEITAPLEGKFYLTKNTTETPIKVGDQIKEGDLIGYIEAMKTFNAIKADKAGKVVEVKNAGEDVEEDDVLVLLG
ncbi:MAG: oxaloacetate decarboxylase [Prolixibacteraceae bacterium]|jgi:pyruvate carboxylase subunit B|nr:oxaloacetate decarboxylase [Prolixibacteraceae bacterium]